MSQAAERVSTARRVKIMAVPDRSGLVYESQHTALCALYGERLGSRDERMHLCGVAMMVEVSARSL